MLLYHEAYEKALRQRTKLLLGKLHPLCESKRKTHHTVRAGVEPPKSTVSKPEKAEDDVQDEVR